MRTSALARLELAVLLVLLLGTDSALARHPGGERIRAWDELALHTVRTLRLSDAQAARLYAMVNRMATSTLTPIRRGCHALAASGPRRRDRRHQPAAASRPDALRPVSAVIAAERSRQALRDE